MSIAIIGGHGFIARRLTRLLADQGQEVLCLDVSPRSPVCKELGNQVECRRVNVSQFDDMLAALSTGSVTRIVNLAYLLGGKHAAHRAFKVNVLGMDNSFEAARLLGIPRIVFASSMSVYGEQICHGAQHVTEDSPRLGTGQYARHKIFNEDQAEDYREKYGMSITAVRPAHVTGSDKIIGSLDHVMCITGPARGLRIRLRHRDLMRCPIHADEVARVFREIVMSDAPRHSVYNTGGTPVSLGELAQVVREFIPEADIEFEYDTGGLAESSCYLIDNSRLMSEFDIDYRPFDQQVMSIIEDVRV